MKKSKFSVIDYRGGDLPSFGDANNNDWISFGSDNLYPYYLEDLYSSSSMNGALVKGISDMIYGGGLDSPTKDEHVDEWLRLQRLFGDGDALKRACFDLKLYGNCYLNPIWSVDRSTIAEVHHVPASNVRVGQSDDQDNVLEFYFSANWAEVNKPEFTPQVLPAFSTEDRTAASQLIHIKLYNPISFAYGLCDYVGSTNYIELDKDISEFHLANIKNGLFPSMSIAFSNGIPTDEERIAIERGLYQKFGGAQSAGKLLISFNDSKDDAPQIEPIQLADPHRMYEYLSKEVSAKILSGHRVTSPLLFGLRSDGGGFGSNADEMREAFDIFQTTVIDNFQQVMLNGIRPITAAASFTLPLYFKKYVPASFMNEPVKPEPEVQSYQFEGLKKKEKETVIEYLKGKNSKPGKDYHLLKSESVDNQDYDLNIHESKKRNFDKEDPSEEPYDVIGPNGYRFSVRYYYEETAQTPALSNASRDFCQDMMALSDGGYEYRYEDIQEMEGDNIEFAHEGRPYSIWLHKGGIYCRHGWVRNIYIYAPDGEPTEVETIEYITDWDSEMKRVGNNFLVAQPGEEIVAPIDTATRGAYR